MPKKCTKPKKTRPNKKVEDDDAKSIGEYMKGSDTETEEDEVTDEVDVDENPVAVSVDRSHKKKR